MVTEIEQRHFLHAMNTARRSVPESMIAEYEAFVKSMKADNAEATGFKFDDAIKAADVQAKGGKGSAPEATSDSKDDEMY